MNCRPFRNRARERGTALAIIVTMLTALLGFLGIAIYTGLNAYLQNELQNAVSSSAGAGAAAFFDTFDANGVPQVSSAEAQLSAQTTFDNIIAANPAMTSFGVAMTGAPTLNVARQTVTVEATATVPTPFLALVGISDYTVDATSTARYARMNVDTTNFTINTKTGPYYRILNVDPPLVDGPGPDMFVSSAATGGGYHGIIVELCSAGKCYDVGRAALPQSADAIVSDRDYPGFGTRRVLYGDFYIDLGGTGLGYNQHVKKGAAIRIVDDGVQDYIVVGSGGSQRGIELDPQPTEVAAMRMFHYSVFCADQNLCSLPTGFEFAGG